MKKAYIIFAHVEDVTLVREAYLSENKAEEQLRELRKEALPSVYYSLQPVPLDDEEE